MQKVSKLDGYLNEASLRGNVGIPGEEGSGRASWLDKITRRSDANARQFAQQNMRDIQNFMGLVMRSQEIQRGHEKELEILVEDSIRQVFGSLIDDITLDLKIVTKRDIKSEMEETPEEMEMPDLEEIEDETILNAIQVRKILRTVQQGKALNVKAILNLSLFKTGLTDILGEQAAAEYISTLNKVSNIAQFFDWDIPEDVQKGAWQTREGFSGSVKLEFPDEEEHTEEEQDAAQAVLASLEEGEDIVDNDAVEDLLADVNTTIRARGVDLSVLIHETIKGIYMLTTQYSLEVLSETDAEKVISNTDTLFDELQELKFGRQMQEVLFKQVAEHPIVLEKINDMTRENAEDYEIAAFQEKINFLFFGKLIEVANTDPKEMLRIVNEILFESDEAIRLSNPLINAAIKDLEQEERYQREKRGEFDTDKYNYEEEYEEPDYGFPTPEPSPSREMKKDDFSNKDEIINAIIDAHAKGDMEEVRRLESMLGESINIFRFDSFIKIFESK